MSILISDLAPKVPSTLKQNQKFANSIIARTTRSWTTQSNVYGPRSQPQINIKIPSVGFIDPLTVNFNGLISFTSGCRLSKSLNSVFKRITIRTQSGDVLMDTNEWNVLSNVLSDFSLTQSEMEGTFSSTNLYGSDTYREQIAPGVRFSFTLNAAIFRQPSILPLHKLGSLDITFWLEDAATAFIKVDQSLTSFDYNISNFEVSMDCLTVTPQIEALFEQAWQNDKLSYPLTTWTHVPFQSASMVESFRIETLNNSNRCIVVVPRQVSRLLDPNVNSFQRSAGSLRFVQFSLGSNLLKRYQADGGAAELMAQIQKALDWSQTGVVTPYNYHCQLQGLTAAQDALKSSKFAIFQDLEISKLDEGIQSGSSRIPVTLTLEYAAPIQNTQYDIFILSDVQLICGQSVGTRVLV